MSTAESAPTPEPIPATLNVILSFVAYAVAGSLLWLASHASAWWWIVLAAMAFSFVNNTIFSLLHESVHGLFHPNRKLNEWFGRVAAAFFPTALTFQRIFHLSHHRHNRTELEQFDYIRPGDNKLLKYAQWYSILTGLYWIFSPVGCLIYLLCPWVFRLRLLRGKNSNVAHQTGADAMLSGFDEAPGLRIRLEILMSLLVQIGLVLLLDLSLLGWAACYAAFAVNWSSLQYADHAFSELDVHQGAWNLRVNRVVQFIFLNYHHHRAHHQRPDVPWIHLHKHVDFSERRPSFIGTYLNMWLGPRPLPHAHQDGPAAAGAAEKTAHR